MSVYYNENDPKAAAWLRQLILAGLIPQGTVDERDIRDIRPEEISEYTQCHFFAGIGGWSRALQLSGWGRSDPVWTGSCPCQPFSSAGRRKGNADERHLWPHWFHLIEQCRPPVIFGEQVASKDGRAWLDTVSTDMEECGYAIGAADLCAAGVGAPHIRQRLWFVGHANRQGPQGGPRESAQQGQSATVSSESGVVADTVPAGRPKRRPESGDRQAAGSGSACELGDPCGERTGGNPGTVHFPEGFSPEEREAIGRFFDGPEYAGAARKLANSDSTRFGEGWAGQKGDGPGSPRIEPAGLCDAGVFWSATDWIECRDGKTRAVEPGAFPLAHGIPGRVGLLRGYGNAIIPQVAAEFIGAFMDFRK